MNYVITCRFDVSKILQIKVLGAIKGPLLPPQWN